MITNSLYIHNKKSPPNNNNKITVNTTNFDCMENEMKEMTQG